MIVSADHRHHDWAVGLDCYYCTVDGCDAERSLTDQDLSAVVVTNDAERRAVERVLRDLRRPGVVVHVQTATPSRFCPSCGYPAGAP